MELDTEVIDYEPDPELSSGEYSQWSEPLSIPHAQAVDYANLPAEFENMFR